MAAIDSKTPILTTKGSLVIVCCHAIYLPAGPSSPEQVADEANWLLADFQRGTADKEGEHLTFIRHIQRAHEAAEKISSSDNHVHVIFSGGATKSETPKSEARGYLDASLSLYPQDAQDHGNITYAAEERATDSYQNILFSLLKYHELTAHWPSHVTVVTHAFKTDRIRLHLSALKWPAMRSSVEGVDPPFGEDERRSVEGFERRCLADWERDLYGVRPPLSEKRRQRRWMPDGEMYTAMTGDKIVRELLEWDGGEDPRVLFPMALPWE